MELPFTVVFEPPSPAELRAVLRMRGTWIAGLLALAVGTGVVAWHVSRSDAAASALTVPVELTSRPPGAGVWLDGRERGQTPLAVQVEAGTHGVLLKAPDAQEGQYTVVVGDQPAALDAVLWRRQPTLARLRPSLPGATLSDVRLLGDGELALSIALPPDNQLQAWRLDPQRGGLEQLLTNVTGTRLVVAPDGHHVAFIGNDIGPPAHGSDTSGRASVLWLVAGDHLASTTGWRPPLLPGEQVLDASWSPLADRLLVVTGEALAGGTPRSRLWFVDPDGRFGHAVLTLPSEILRGSEVWSPNGQHIALLAHAGVLNALCLVDLDGGFRYLADLDSLSAPPPGYLPATWAADSQQLLFIAPPDQHPPGVPLGWVLPDARHQLYVARAADPAPVRVRTTDADFAAWREDGQVVELARHGSDRGLALRVIDESGSVHQMLDLPVRPAADYAAVWDLARARMVLVTPAPVGGVDYWLAMFGVEGAS